jgi:hypothetical protein
VEIKLSKIQGSVHVKEPAIAKGFSKKNNKSNGSSWPEILAKTGQFGLAQTNPYCFSHLSA